MVTASPTSLSPAARKAATLSAGKRAALSDWAFPLNAGAAAVTPVQLHKQRSRPGQSCQQH